MTKKRLQFMKDRPQIADAEIQHYMNFNSVVEKHKALKSKRKKGIYRSLTGLMLVSALVTSYFLFQRDSTELNPAAVSDTDVSITEAPLPGSNLPDPTSDPTAITAEEKVNPQALPEVTEKKKVDNLLESTEANTAAPIPSQTKESNDIQNKPTPTLAYEEAEPLEGYQHLYEYFSLELRYPPEAMKDSIQGIVVVTFVINREGLPERIQISNSLGKLFDDESIRLVQQMPAWRPAKLNGNPVPAKVSLPLTFQIQSLKTQKP